MKCELTLKQAAVALGFAPYLVNAVAITSNTHSYSDSPVALSGNQSFASPWGFVSPYDFDNGINLIKHFNLTGRDVPAPELSRTVCGFAGAMAMGGWLLNIGVPAFKNVMQSCGGSADNHAECALDCAGGFGAGVIGAGIVGLFYSAWTGDQAAGTQLQNLSPGGSRDRLNCKGDPVPANFCDTAWGGQMGIKMFCDNTGSETCQAVGADAEDARQLLKDLMSDMIIENAMGAQFTLYDKATNVVHLRCGMVIETGPTDMCPELITGGSGCTYTGTPLNACDGEL